MVWFQAAPLFLNASLRFHAPNWMRPLSYFLKEILNPLWATNNLLIPPSANVFPLLILIPFEWYQSPQFASSSIWLTTRGCSSDHPGFEFWRSMLSLAATNPQIPFKQMTLSCISLTKAWFSKSNLTFVHFNQFLPAVCDGMHSVVCIIYSIDKLFHKLPQRNGFCWNPGS